MFRKRNNIKSILIPSIFLLLLLSLYFACYVHPKLNYDRIRAEVINENVPKPYVGLKRMMPNEKSNWENKKDEPAALPDISEETRESSPAEHVANMEIDEEKLRGKNPDYVGWLDIPGTGISYPVVKGKDNNEYLHKDFETGKYSYPGTLFMDAWGNEGDKNLIIYGHNMKNGSMFGKLKNFGKGAWFDKFLYIDFYKADGTVLTYKIFSARKSTSDINSLSYKLEGFSTAEYKERVKGAGMEREIDVSSDPDIITLSTCVNDNSKRFIVNGVRIQ